MEDGLLSLKWNNHKDIFLQVLSLLRRNAVYTDATLACDGKFYPIHKFVASTCSEYFKEIFKQITSSSPVIVLNDIKCNDLESLLDYMYLGEVDIKQNDLGGLVKAAECLKIKGLAAPDQFPISCKQNYISENNTTRLNKRQLPESAINITNKKSKMQSYSNISSNDSSAENNTKFEQMDDDSSCVDIFAESVNNDSEDIEVKEEKIDNSAKRACEGVPILSNEIDEFNKIESIQSSYDVKQKPGPSRLQEDSNLLHWTEGQQYNDIIFEDSMNNQQMDISLQRRRLGVTYQCLYCIKKFRDKTKWTTHSRTHTGEKPYQCPYCFYRASIKTNVNRHIANLHYSLIS